MATTWLRKSITNDTPNQWNKFSVAVSRESTLRILKCTQHDVGEGASEVDRVVEVVHGEDVLAGLDGGLSGARQDTIGS